MDKRKKRSTKAAPKRKLPNKPAANGHSKKKKRIDDEVEEKEDTLGFSAAFSSDEEKEEEEPEEVEDPFQNETPDERRLRLAKELLSNFEAQREDIDGDEFFVSEKLQEDVMETRGIVRRDVAARVASLDTICTGIRLMRGHDLSATALALSGDDTTAYSASKDSTCIKWDVETGKKLFRFGQNGKKKGKDGDLEAHQGHVLAIDVSSDGNYLATGGFDKFVKIWGTRSNTLIDTLKGHRDRIMGLAFRKNSHDLYSASDDRTIKQWNLDEMAYVDSLYGHESFVTCVDALTKEKVLTAGADKTVRLWMIQTDTQLIFRSPQQGVIDCTTFINEEKFLSGAQDGSIALWNASKKKPLAVVQQTHGLDSESKQPNWITSIASCKHTDIFCTGSNNGIVRLWKTFNTHTAIAPLRDIPVTGFINGLKFSSKGNFVIAAVGQEHRLGRWSRIKEARNGLTFIPLSLSQ